MNAEFECRATAAGLRALRPLVAAAQVGAMVAGVRLGVGVSDWLAASLALWGLGLYLAVRVSLDAQLLDLLAADPAGHPGRLDEFLVRAGLRAAPVNRSVEERCRGARRWARWLLLAIVCQLAVLAVGLARTAH